MINVFVSNPTDIPLEFGRDMRFYLWKNDKWCPPEQRDTSYTIVWNSEAFMIEKAPLLYCFRYKLNEYYIPKGKYRVQKSFSRGDEHILLQYADWDAIVRHQKNRLCRLGLPMHNA